MRRGERKRGRKKRRITNRRQCATRVKKIISMEIPRSFYSQRFVDVTSIGESERERKRERWEMKLVSKSVLRYYLYTCKRERSLEIINVSLLCVNGKK